MKLELEFKASPQAGEVFTINNDGNRTPYMFVEAKKSDSNDLCPLKILDMNTGIIIARSTSWGLALRDIGINKGMITFRGVIKRT